MRYKSFLKIQNVCYKPESVRKASGLWFMKLPKLPIHKGKPWPKKEIPVLLSGYHGFRFRRFRFNQTHLYTKTVIIIDRSGCHIGKMAVRTLPGNSRPENGERTWMSSPWLIRPAWWLRPAQRQNNEWLYWELKIDMCYPQLYVCNDLTRCILQSKLRTFGILKWACLRDVTVRNPCALTAVFIGSKICQKCWCSAKE